jgi:hypothetical protein
MRKVKLLNDHEGLVVFATVENGSAKGATAQSPQLDMRHCRGFGALFLVCARFFSSPRPFLLVNGRKT